MREELEATMLIGGNGSRTTVDARSHWLSKKRAETVVRPVQS